MLSFLLLITALSVVISAYLKSSEFKFEKKDTLPTLTLPYGTWKASNYNTDSDIYTFKNVRYAAPPVGDLRWAKPVTPVYNATLQDGSYGPKCIQGAPKGLNLLGPGDDSPIGAAVNQFLGGIPIPIFEGGDEDCLFLDLYVPGKAIRNETESALPVVVWIYGGAYLFGAKDMVEPILPFYDGSGLVDESGGDLIFVSINYRLGAFGWLAGTTMEQDALPNAGLWDQKAAFDWVQSYISIVGGDPAQVTAMGESAGAGSILHHLVAEGGTATPTFAKAILQSPAYQFMWDRNGTIEETFQKFATFANCSGQGLSCLRAASTETLITANIELNSNTTDGTFAVGPAADGSYVRQLAVLELVSGNFHAPDSLIISHVAEESILFVDGSVETDAEFSSFVDVIFPAEYKAADVNALIEEFYPSVDTNDTYATETDRMIPFIRDSSFTTNVRVLTEAIGDANVWNMQYSVSPGYHATDIIPSFYDSAIDLDSLAEDLFFDLVPGYKDIVETYQSYLTSYVIYGDPNTAAAVNNSIPAVVWEHPDSSAEEITGVLNVGDSNFTSISDNQDQKTSSDFWISIAAAVTNLGGYAPPGAVVNQTLVPVPNDPSANY